MSEVLFEASRALSIAVFFFYGWFCLASKRMRLEFERYGLESLRKLTGMLELAGALGLLAGYFYAPLIALTSACFCLLMCAALATRIRIRDSLAVSLPAWVLLLMNVYILVFSLAHAPA